MARGASSETSDPSEELISRSKLMTPRPMVTGSMRRKTWRMRASRQSTASVSRKPALTSWGSVITNWTTVPMRTPMA